MDSAKSWSFSCLHYNTLYLCQNGEAEECQDTAAEQRMQTFLLVQETTTNWGCG